MTSYSSDYETGSNDFLVRKQTEIVSQSEAILRAAEREDRELSDGESTELVQLEGQFERLKTQVEVASRVNLMRNAYPGVGRKTTPDDLMSSYSVRSWGHGGSVSATGRFRNTFGRVDTEMYGFKDGHDWFRAAFGAMTGQFDPRLTMTGSSTGEGASGGFYMPLPVVGGLFDASIAASVLLPRVRIVPVTAKHTTFPRFEQADRSVGLVGGFEGRWIGEGGTSTDQKAKVAALNVATNKLGIYTKATSELIADSALFVSEFEPALARAAAYTFDEAVARGTGVGQPLGLLNDPTVVTVAKEAGQAADTFNFANASKMFAALYPAGVSRAVWVVHPSVLPTLIQTSNPVKNVAGTENVGGTAAVMVASDGSITLLGRPVLTSEHLNGLGDLGDIVFVDLSQYGLFMRKEASVETSNAVYWSTDELAYRLIMRATGMGLWEGVGQRPNSGGNESWLVKLEAR